MLPFGRIEMLANKSKGTNAILRVDEEAHAISADLVVLRRRIDALAPADNLVGAAEDGVRVTPAGKDVSVHLFAQKEGAYWAGTEGSNPSRFATQSQEPTQAMTLSLRARLR